MMLVRTDDVMLLYYGVMTRHKHLFHWFLLRVYLMLTQNEYFFVFCRVNKIGPLFTRYINIYVLTYLYISPNCHHPWYNPFYGDISYTTKLHDLPPPPTPTSWITPHPKTTIPSQIFVHVQQLLKKLWLKTYFETFTYIYLKTL